MTSVRKKQSKKTLDIFKLPPHSSQAEESVLGGLLLQNDCFDEINSFLTEEDFYYTENKLLFKAIRNLLSNNFPCDALTIIDFLKSNNQIDDVGGEFKIFNIINNIPSAANLLAYAKIVYEKSVLRKLLTATSEISEMIYNNSESKLEEILERSEGKIFNLSYKSITTQSVITQKDALKKTIERVDRLYQQDSTYSGYETGFRDFDKITMGLQKKDLIIIAGRPSMGKTTFAMNIVEYMTTKLNKPVLIASLEMGEEQLMGRMISSVGKIEHDKVFSGKLSDMDWPKFSAAVKILNETNITFIIDGYLSPSALRSYARKTIKKYGELGLIVIDYLQLMSLRDFKENRTLEIAAISRELKLLAKEIDVPVIVISQLNRNLEQRQDKRPTMADLRDSGSIEQDADLICLIYRDEVYNEDSNNRGVAELIIAKQRNGKIGKINLNYNGQYMRFDNLNNDIPLFLQ